jgi:hypothetical protein
MTYMLRERPDGQVEIVVTKAMLVGVFPEREVAERVCVFLQEEEVDWPEETADSFAAASEDIPEPEDEALAEPDAGEVRLRGLVERARDVSPPVARPAPSRKPMLPVVVEKPVAPAMIPVDETALSETQLETAITRLAAGEKLKDVALDLGVSFNCLRGHWARHCRTLQKHMAEGGQQPCSMCNRTFTPSVTNPDKCARCSHE